MSKSSKRRLAIAAIKNAQSDTPFAAAAPSQLPRSAKSLLQAAAQTASATPVASPQRATGIRVAESPGRPGVPLSQLGLPPYRPNPNSKTPLLDSVRASSVLPLESDLLASRDPLVPYALSDSPSSPLLNSQLPTLNSSSDSASAPSLPSSQMSNLKSEIASSTASLSSPPLNSQLPTLNSSSDSASAPSLSSSQMSNLKSEIASSTASLSSPPLNSQLSTLNSPLDSVSPSSSEISSLESAIASPSGSPSALSTPHSALCPALSAARTSLLQSTQPDPALAAITPDQIFIDLPPLPPKPPSPFTNSTEATTTQQSPVPPSTPVQDEFADYQAKLRTAMREWSPADPRIKTMLENYATILQTVTLERLNSTLPTLSESAWVETNAHIIRLHSVMERTNSRHSREQREIAAQARRELRELQRKERQTQKDAEALARNQRTKEREEQRRQREKAKADRAEQSHQLAIRKLDLKERNLKLCERENQLEEKLKHNNSAKSAQSPAAQKPLGPPNTWTCG